MPKRIKPPQPSVRNRILAAIRDHIRLHGEPPKTVALLCDALGISEREFFSEFASIAAAEAELYLEIVERVRGAVASGAEWEGFGARQRMLAFLYAFFEGALDCRSLLLARVAPYGPLAKPRHLRKFESAFREFAKSVVDHGIETGEIAVRGKLGSLYPEALTLAFRSAVDYFLKDESEGFVDTDAYVEKSVAFAFDLLRSQAIDSAFDLARFMVGPSRNTQHPA